MGINGSVARGIYQLHLERSFSAKDWQYLCQNNTFKGLLSVSKDTVDDFEHLIEIAALLLQRRDDLDWIAAVRGIRSPYTLHQRMAILQSPYPEGEA